MKRSYAKPIVLLVLSIIGLSPDAKAQFSTGGSGKYRNNILWFDWGTAPNIVPNFGESVTNTASVAGKILSVTCSLSAISGSGPDPDLEIYIPGNFNEDGLDDLYNIGGVGPSNRMDISLRTRKFGSNASFNFKCSATLDGLPYALEGLILADGETTSIGESTTITPPSGSIIRVIEAYREPGCTTGYKVNLSVGTYQFRSLPPYTCPSPFSGTSGSAPMGVFFIDGATEATILLNGPDNTVNGLQAVSLGVFLNVADYGDAPSSYGVAGHLPQYTWGGGALGQGDTNIFDNDSISTQLQPSNARLGSLVDIEAVSTHSIAATSDDNDGSDEDGIDISGLSPLYKGLVGKVYSVPLRCSGTSAVAGWIDLDRSGSFDADERSATANCAGGVATLSWVVNEDISAGDSYLRVRTAVLEDEIITPSGLAGSGEVEDYQLLISDPTIRIAKLTPTDTGGPFIFSTTNTLEQPADLITASAGVETFNTPVSIRSIGTSVLVSERNLPAGWTVAAIACAESTGSPVAGAIYDLIAGTAMLPAAAITERTEATCKFTNDFSSIADLGVTKFANTNEPVQPGDVITYTLTVKNNGPSAADNAVLRDQPGPGLDCTVPDTMAACTAIGGAACPSASVPVSTLIGSGISIPLLPVGGQILVELKCSVTATGF